MRVPQLGSVPRDVEAVLALNLRHSQGGDQIGRRLRLRAEHFVEVHLRRNLDQDHTQLERDTIVERTRAGLDAAKAQGRVGRRPSVVDAKKMATIKKLVKSGDHSRADIARMVDVSQATLYRVISTL